MTISTKTCLDCPAKVSGKATRCLACNKARTLEKNKAAAARYKAKMAGQVPAVAPASGGGSLGTYEEACRAVAAAKTTAAAKDIRDKSDALRVYALRAKDMQMVIDVTEIRIRAERRLGEIVKLQKETIGLNTGAMGIGKSAVAAIDRTPTLADAGISKDLSSAAQKLAALPEGDFESRIKTWRGNIETGKAKPTVNLLTPKTKTPRKENDAYYSPVAMVNEVIARWKPVSKRIMEPCSGDGRFADALEAAGYVVERGDIITGQDFFEIEEATAPALCTNPPFKTFDENGKAIDEKNIRGFIDHAFAIGITEMCLIVPERLFSCDVGRKQFEKHKPAIVAHMDWREDYLGKGGQANMMLGVAIWDSPCAERCDYEIWSRENQPD